MSRHHKKKPDRIDSITRLLVAALRVIGEIAKIHWKGF